LKEKETSSSDEESGVDEDDNVDESEKGEDDTEDDEVEEDDKVGNFAINADENSTKNSVKKDGGKLDKAGLNEFLIKLRRPITQAKVHVIHKLTKDISMLRRKKTKSEVDKSKNERKVTRFVQEVQVLRKEKKDTMARWVVANDVTLEQVTREETASQKIDLRLRAMARVAEHKAVRTILEGFRVKYPRWKSRVPKLLRSLGKKRKKADPNMEPLGVKALGQSKKSVHSESNRDESEESSDDGMDTLTGDDEKDFASSLKSLATTPREKKPMAKTSSSGLEKESVKIAKSSKTSDKKKAIKEVENNQMEVKVLDLKGDSKDTISVVQKKKANVLHSSVQPIKPETKKSSFFVGGESEDDSGGEEGEEEEEDGHQPWQVASGRGEGYFSKKTGGGEFAGGRGQVRGRGSQGPVRGGAGRSAEDANLHPSWQAKKRAPPAVAQFQGKKTKFGTEGEAVRSNSTAPSKDAKSQEPVHPSWAAKQSQKSTIQSFQGKKMVFDD